MSTPAYTLYKDRENGYGCAPCALNYLTGIGIEVIWMWLLSYRAAHPLSPNGLPCRKEEALMDEDDHCAFLPEVEAFLSYFFGGRFRFKPVTHKTLHKFIPTLPHGKTFLLHTKTHLLVVQDGCIYDTRTCGDSVDDYDFRWDRVDCYLEMPGFGGCS